MNKALAVALLAAAAAASAGCAGSERARAARLANPAPCPNVVVLNDAARQIDFSGSETLENVAFSGEIVGVQIRCRYYDDRPIEADVRVEFAFGRGPAAETFEKDFKYFVAVTRTNVEVIEKAEFIIPVKFGSSDTVKTARERIDQIKIPRANKDTAGTNFEIVIGFAVTPQQAIFNRSGKSLQYPEL